MRKKQGFTIIELLIVVIIIGVLATMAVPQFTTALEKAKASKAKNMLALMYKGANMIRAENPSNEFDGTTDGIAADIDNIVGYIDLDPITSEGDSDGEWTYTTAQGTDTWEGTATREGTGSNSGCEVAFDQDQAFTFTGCLAGIR